MNPCFSPLRVIERSRGAAAVHNGFLGGLLKHHAVRALVSFAPSGLDFQEDRRAAIHSLLFVRQAINGALRLLFP